MDASQNKSAVRECPIAEALDIVGEKWSLLIVRELLLGNHRFAQIAALTGAPRDILTTRLRKLEGAGILERHRYSDRPERYDYRLTDAGLALAPVLAELRRWGEERRSLPDDAPQAGVIPKRARA